MVESFTADQKSAFEKFKMFLSMGGGGFFLLTGPAGAGKSFMMGAMMEEVNSTGQRVALAASTHKAAKVASDFVEGADVATAHALLGISERSIGRNGDIKMVPGKKYLEKAYNYQIFFVDEASMLDDVVFGGFEDLVADNKKVVFIGDSFQIPPVNTANSLPFDVDTQRDLNFTIANLTEVVRQAKGSPIIQEATEVRKFIFRPVLPFDYQSKVNGLLAVRYAENDPPNELSQDILDMFDSDSFRENPDYCKVLAWRNKTVDAYNSQIRTKLFGDGIPKLMVGEKLTADAPYMEGRQTLIKNNEDMEVLSLKVEQDEIGKDNFLTIYKAHVKVFGSRGSSREVIVPIIHEDSEEVLKKYLNLLAAMAKQERPGSYAAKDKWMDFYKLKERYAATKYSYCMTVHKAQGSTYDHAVLCLWDIMFNRKTEERNRIIYTGITRPKFTLKIIH